MSEHRPGIMPRKRLGTVIIAVAAVALTGLTWVIGWLPPMERATGDLLLRTSSLGIEPQHRVMAVLIDDRAIDRYGPMPWDRDLLARMVSSLRASEVHGLAIDLILPGSPEPAADAALAEALDGIPVVLAAAFDSEGRWILPDARFGGTSKAAHAYGEVGPDGVVRTLAATKQGQGLALPALSLAAARILQPGLAIKAGSELRPEFRPAPQEIPVLSAASVLDGSYDRQEVSGAVVFMGVAATGVGDQFVVPTGPRHQPVPGVLAHASATISMLNRRLVRVPGPAWTAIAALVIALGIQVIRDRRGVFDFAAFAAVAAGVMLLSMIALRYGLLLIPVTSLLITAVASALLRETTESWAARRESGLLLSALLQHVGGSPSRVPNTAAGRLDALRRLQRRVLDEDTTRKALLTDMAEGVVLWDRDRRILLANPAAERLWGGMPELDDIVQVSNPSDPIIIARGAREIGVGVTELERGHLAILRDVTAERALERRRREMQRLVSHELKTPLSSIAGFGESLERYELDGHEQRRVASLIRGEARRLQAMVSAFLDLEQLGGGRWDGAAEDVDLGHRVGSRLDVLEAAARERGITISRSIADDCRIRGVPALLDRVVDNLVGNAIKYTRAGDEITVEVRRSGDAIHLTVCDHGPGIPEDALPRVFDRFYRVPGTTEAGAGLGLAMVKEVVDWHGGCIEIHSEVGDGSTFVVSLPATQEV